MSKILIIGANSASGKALYDYAGNTNDDFYFCDLPDSGNRSNYINWFNADLASFEDVYQVIREISPNTIYNFAGSLSNDYEIDYTANVLLPKFIFDSIVKLDIDTRILLIGSAAEYGIIDECDNPIKETHSLNPASIYGLSKVYQTNLMKYYYNKYGVNVVMARTFNLLGKNISDELFIGRLYRQIEELKKGAINKILLGNTDNRRDYIRIEEAIKKYIIIMQRGKAGEVYNVGSGSSIRIGDLLENVLKENGLTLEATGIRNMDNKLDIHDIFADISKVSVL